jgi:hypothetical protein
MRLADTFQPSKFVWIYDEWADIIVVNGNPNNFIRNSYDDYNKSILGFMDGHAAYVRVRPGNNAQSFSNSDYTMVFSDLRLP